MAALRLGAILVLAFWIAPILPQFSGDLPGIAAAASAKCSASRNNHRARCPRLASRVTMMKIPEYLRSSNKIMVDNRRRNLRQAPFVTQIPHGLRYRKQPDYETITSSHVLRCRSRYGPRGLCSGAQPEGNGLVRALIEPPQSEANPVLDEAGIPVIAGVPPIVIITPVRLPPQTEPSSAFDKLLP